MPLYVGPAASLCLHNAAAQSLTQALLGQLAPRQPLLEIGSIHFHTRTHPHMHKPIASIGLPKQAGQWVCGSPKGWANGFANVQRLKASDMTLLIPHRCMHCCIHLGWPKPACLAWSFHELLRSPQETRWHPQQGAPRGLHQQCAVTAVQPHAWCSRPQQPAQAYWEPNVCRTHPVVHFSPRACSQLESIMFTQTSKGRSDLQCAHDWRVPVLQGLEGPCPCTCSSLPKMQEK